jgi:hypothetical protein
MSRDTNNSCGCMSSGSISDSEDIRDLPKSSKGLDLGKIKVQTGFWEEISKICMLFCRSCDMVS